jgi:hypothetical protein
MPAPPVPVVVPVPPEPGAPPLPVTFPPLPLVVLVAGPVVVDVVLAPPPAPEVGPVPLLVVGPPDSEELEPLHDQAGIETAKMMPAERMSNRGFMVRISLVTLGYLEIEQWSIAADAVFCAADGSKTRAHNP